MPGLGNGNAVVSPTSPTTRVGSGKRLELRFFSHTISLVLILAGSRNPSMSSREIQGREYKGTHPIEEEIQGEEIQGDTREEIQGDTPLWNTREEIQGRYKGTHHFGR